MCCILGQVVRAVGQNELPGSAHVSASSAYQAVDGERHRAVVE